jgi:hypothetical protein
MASTDPKTTTQDAPPAEQKPAEKAPAALGEDDEFEDFPVDSMLHTPPDPLIEIGALL